MCAACYTMQHRLLACACPVCRLQGSLCHTGVATLPQICLSIAESSLCSMTPSWRCGLFISSPREHIKLTVWRSAWDLLELYCGNGNFTVPLAANFRRVVATEVSKASVVAAQHNMKASLLEADAGPVSLSHKIPSSELRLGLCD